MARHSSLGAALKSASEAFGSKPAIVQRDGPKLLTISYRELLERARSLGAALRAAGVLPGDRVALISENRPEWSIVDWGAQIAGVVTVPMFPSLAVPQVQYILQDSGSKIVFCEDAGLVEKCRQAAARLTPEPRIVCFENVPATETLEGFLASREDTPFEDAEPEPDDICTLIYTSGTTGQPKGVMLTHRNLLSNIQACLEALEVGPKDVFLWTLPLSHVFSRMAAHFLPIVAGATIACGKSLRTLAEDMQVLRPTLILMVPRFLEQIMHRIETNVERENPLRRSLFRWALSVGMRMPPRGSRDRTIPLTLRLQAALADRTVGRKVRARFGGRLRFMVSGAAPLSPDVSAFFHAFGILVLQGYGLTETSPVVSVNRPENNRFDTVGPPIPGVEVRIAEDGEILVRGPNVMKGYYGLLDATREVLSPDGWFATGDVGEITDEGHLKITDRKKDIIVLASGKNVAPQQVESVLKSSSLIEEAVVLGDRQPVITALIVPNYERLQREIGATTDNPEELASMPEAMKRMRTEVDQLCESLAEFERVRRFALLPQPFSIESGELTPTLKVRRNVVQQKYGDLIKSLFSQ